jgi:hypothetical protein
MANTTLHYTRREDTNPDKKTRREDTNPDKKKWHNTGHDKAKQEKRTQRNTQHNARQHNRAGQDRTIRQHNTKTSQRQHHNTTQASSRCRIPESWTMRGRHRHCNPPWIAITCNFNPCCACTVFPLLPVYAVGGLDLKHFFLILIPVTRVARGNCRNLQQEI